MNLADAIAQRLELRRGEARDLALEVVEILHQAGRWIGRKGLVRIEDANQGVAVVVGQEELVAPVAGCRGGEEKAGPDLVGDEAFRCIGAGHDLRNGLQERGQGGKPLLAIDDGRRIGPDALGRMRRDRGDRADVVVVDAVARPVRRASPSGRSHVFQLYQRG